MASLPSKPAVGRPQRSIWRWLIWLAPPLLIWLAIREVPLADVWHALSGLRPWQLGALTSLNALSLLAFTGCWWVVLGALGFRLPFLSLTRGRVGAFGVAYFIPGPQVGGEAFQFFWIRQRHAVPIAEATASIALDKTLEILVNVVIVVLGVVALTQRNLLSTVSTEMVVALVTGMLGLPLLFLATVYAGWRPLTRLLAALPRAWRRRPWFRALFRTLHATERHMTGFCRAQPAAFAIGLAWVCASWLIMLTDYWLSVRFLGVTLTLPEVLMGVALSRLSILVPLPGALGALEGSQVLFMTLLGHNPALGLTQSLVMRARDVAVAVFGLGWAVAGSRFRFQLPA